MAAWCLTTRQTPETFNTLTALERDAFLAEAERLGYIKRR